MSGDCLSTASEIALLIAAAAGIGLSLICLAVAASYKWRAEAWEQAYCRLALDHAGGPVPVTLPAEVVSFEPRARPS